MYLSYILKIVAQTTGLQFKSSRPEVFCKEGVLRNFSKFTGKHLWQSLFFNKVAGDSDAGAYDLALKNIQTKGQ